MSHKTTAILYFTASVCFYIVAVVKLFCAGFSSGVIWLCLGSAFLCLGSVALNKCKSDKENNSNENQHHTLLNN